MDNNTTPGQSGNDASATPLPVAGEVEPRVAVLLGAGYTARAIALSASMDSPFAAEATSPFVADVKPEVPDLAARLLDSILTHGSASASRAADAEVRQADCGDPDCTCPCCPSGAGGSRGDAGVAGYFRGDWGDEADFYPAVRFGRSWNGWAVPYVTGEVAQRIVATQDRLVSEWDAAGVADENDRLEWIVGEDGVGFIRRYFIVEYAEERVAEGELPYEDIRPVGDDGLYCVSFDWCWSRCGSDGKYEDES